MPLVTSALADSAEVPATMDALVCDSLSVQSDTDGGRAPNAVDFNANDNLNNSCSAFTTVHYHSDDKLDNSDQCNANDFVRSDTVNNKFVHNVNNISGDTCNVTEDNKSSPKRDGNVRSDSHCPHDNRNSGFQCVTVHSNNSSKQGSTGVDIDNRHFHRIRDDSDGENEIEETCRDKAIEEQSKVADDKNQPTYFVSRISVCSKRDQITNSNVDLPSPTTCHLVSDGTLQQDPVLNNDLPLTSTINTLNVEDGQKMKPHPETGEIQCGSIQSQISVVSVKVGSTLNSSFTPVNSSTNKLEPTISKYSSNVDVTSSTSVATMIHPDAQALPPPKPNAFQPQQLSHTPTSLAELPSLPSPIFTITEAESEKPPFDDDEEACIIEMKILQKAEPPNGAPPPTERCDSQLSTLSEKMDICRICHCEGEENNKLISPCLCSGSLKYMHLACLQKWIKSSDKKACELCSFDYIMTTKIRPFKQWERLEMSAAERRKIVYSVTFHIIAITCVIWSLYVLIDRTSEEVNSGTLDWPFWTKLIVVAIGFTGGLVFMYVQCKMYVQLCLRWRSFNKLINIENAPEDADVRAEAAARIKARTGEQGGVVNTIALQEMDSI